MKGQYIENIISLALGSGQYKRTSFLDFKSVHFPTGQHYDSTEGISILEIFNVAMLQCCSSLGMRYLKHNQSWLWPMGKDWLGPSGTWRLEQSVRSLRSGTLEVICIPDEQYSRHWSQVSAGCRTRTGNGGDFELFFIMKVPTCLSLCWIWRHCCWEMGGNEAVHRTSIDWLHLKKVKGEGTLKGMQCMGPRLCRFFQLLVW